MSSGKAKEAKEKKDRSIYSDREKKIFVKICRSIGGGEISKVITEGTSTNQQ